MAKKNQKKNKGKPNPNPKTNQPNHPTAQASPQSTPTASTPNLRLDTREFSKEAHTALVELKQNLSSDYYQKASGLIQGLSGYISTWGLHRMSGDMKKFLAGTAEDTTYKGKVYEKFLERLKHYSGYDFDVADEGSLIYLDLRSYTTLNRLAIQLAKEWSFWAVAVLGEAEES